MRPDMHKVIVGRPRLGGHSARKGRTARDWEDLPRNLGMRKPYGYYGKEFNDHLAPLRRYLRKQVGRPWNKIYSEICQRLKSGHPLHDHLRQHVRQLVYFGDRNDSRQNVYGADLFVDARTGLLRLVKRRRSQEKARRKR